MHGPEPHEPPPHVLEDEPEELVPASLEELAAVAPRTTDLANADAFVAEHGRGFLFVLEWSSWIAWDGQRWGSAGARGRVLAAAGLTARMHHAMTRTRLQQLEAQAQQHAIAGRKDEDLEVQIKYQKRLLVWHEQSQNMSRLEACVRALETKLTTTVKRLDANPLLLNCANGTLDLRSYELREHRRDDYITQICDVEWDERAECPTWERFVEQAMGGKLELVLYLQRLVGYAITGLTTEHVLAFFHGEGNNGKSTFVEALLRMLGEYACAVPRELLIEDRNGAQRHPTELARLHGKRLAVCAETKDGDKLDEAKVKDLTGGTTIAVRRMNEDFWDLQPTHTFLMCGNYKPVVTGTDLGIWRRIRLVPWTVIVAQEDVDTDLPRKLGREHAGILRWAAMGCLEWQRVGLAAPIEVSEATQAYRDESDVHAEFLDEHCLFAADERCPRRDLRERYEEWCKEGGHRALSPRRLAARLRGRGVESRAMKIGVKVVNGWAGVRLMTTEERSAAKVTVLV